VLIAAPWVALIGASVIYAGLLPFSVASYAKAKRARPVLEEAA
jgi:CDP-diacylglycerol---serine O-phosphatidyltransferase